MKTPLLSVEQLGIRAGGRSIVRQVSFTAQAGSVTAVIGPNGAGKTSLLEGIVGLREADGDVRFSGELLTSFSSRARTFAYQPDKAEPAVEATVRTLVAHAFAASSGSPDRTELRRLFDIDPLLDLGAGVLSHGERQRLALFSTLVLARPVVVLDEPFSAFDPLQLRDVLQAIRRVAASGATVLASIHQLADAEKIADHVVFLAEGRTIATGSVAELKAEAGDPALSLEAAFVALLARSSRAS